MGGLSTGMIFLIIGAILLILALARTIVTGRSYHKREKELKEKIWNEYR